MELTRTSDKPVIAKWSVGPTQYVPFPPLMYCTFPAAVIIFVAWMLDIYALPVTIVICGAWVLWIVYRGMYNQTKILYMDEDGIWYSRGLLPWESGVIGVLWRDVDSIEFKMNFLSWLTHTYDISVSERFSRKVEIFVKGVWDGNNAATLMNKKLMEVAGAGSQAAADTGDARTAVG